MRTGVCFGIIAVMLLGTAQVFAAAQDAAPPLPPELKKLDALAGKWHGHGTMYATAFSGAGKPDAVSTCVWSPNGRFLVCDQLVQLPNGPANNLSVFTYSSEDKTFLVQQVRAAEGPTDTTRISIEGATWTYHGEHDINGKHVRFRTLNSFESADRYTYRVEFSDDGEHWTLMGEGVSERMK